MGSCCDRRRLIRRAALAIAATVAAVAGLALVTRRQQTYASAGGATFDVLAVAGRKQVVARAPMFAGGTALAVCASLVLDLGPATIARNGAYLEIDCWAGTVDVLVPADYDVVVYAHRRAGGRVVEPAGPETGEDGRAVLEVDARAYAGVIRVRRVPPRVEAPGTQFPG